MKKEYKIFGGFGFIPYIYYVIMREIKTKTMKNEKVSFNDYKESMVEWVNELNQDWGSEMDTEPISECKNLQELGDYMIEELQLWDVEMEENAYQISEFS